MIRLEHVEKRYPDGTIAVHDLSIDVHDGEIAVLVGPSGCGKTTTLKMINRLIEPTSGHIIIDGDDITQGDVVALRRRIGYVIQQTGLFPHQTVGNNIATVPRLLGWDRAKVKARVTELLELVGLPTEFRDRYPAQLSGGQRQRVGVARALAADPPVLLMDEPFGAIDPVNRTRLQDEFLRLQREVSKTIVFVTHDIEEAVKMGDRIAILNVGGILEQYATPAEILASPASPMVADFVGSDRGLKRLRVTPITPAMLEHPPTAPPDATPGEVRVAAARDHSRFVIAVDADGRLCGHFRVRDNEPPVAERISSWVSVHDSLERALSMTMLTDYGWVAVLDGHRYLGVLSPSSIHDALLNTVSPREALPLAGPPD